MELSVLRLWPLSSKMSVTCSMAFCLASTVEHKRSILHSSPLKVDMVFDGGWHDCGLMVMFVFVGLRQTVVVNLPLGRRLRWTSRKASLLSFSPSRAAHKQFCDAPIDWENPTILTTMHHKNKKVLDFDLQIREALEIMRHDCGPCKGLNEDNGNYVKTDIWRPVFETINR